jgi:hypothetical protein
MSAEENNKPKEKIMSNKRMRVLFILFLFSMLDLWQFSEGVRSVDIVGLFASGALSGAAVAGLFMARNSK